MKANSVSKKSLFTVPIILTVIMWVILFIPAWTMKFWQAWILWSGFSIITFSITAYFINRNPEFLARRTKGKEENIKKKSPLFLKLYYIGFILPGIDFRFNWSNEPLWLVILSNVIVFASYIFIFYVFKQNSYASTTIQVEDNQSVISSGTYSIIRHPMYLGMILMSLFIPLALGSYYSLIPMLLIIPITVMRVKNEEEILLRELKGYRAYCSKTKYRVIPFIW